MHLPAQSLLPSTALSVGLVVLWAGSKPGKEMRSRVFPSALPTWRLGVCRGGSGAGRGMGEMANRHVRRWHAKGLPPFLSKNPMKQHKRFKKKNSQPCRAGWKPDITESSGDLAISCSRRNFKIPSLRTQRNPLGTSEALFFPGERELLRDWTLPRSPRQQSSGCGSVSGALRR